MRYETHLFFEIIQPRSILIMSPALLKMIWTAMGIWYAKATLFRYETR